MNIPKWLLAGGAAALICVGARAAIAASEPLVVHTDGGTLEGVRLASGVKAWLGIPFAAPPVDDLRWKPPEPSHWQGIYHADRFMPECMQILRPHHINHYFGEEATSENCLYMNLWAPAEAKAGDKLPVVVFIYGGAFTIGSAAMPNYGGEGIARRGAVFVNFNYRLGILGFLAHPALSAENSDHVSGNYALLDQIAALRWVRANIARFGGDPDKVVIAGQSAGAYSVSVLQASPLAKGLFRAAVGMSGSIYGGTGLDSATLEDAEKVGLQTQALLGVHSLAEMRQIPADRIVALQAEFQLGAKGGSIRTGPVIDGHVLPNPPGRALASTSDSDVPLLLSGTADEGFGPFAAVTTLAQFRSTARMLYGEQAQALFREYPAGNDAEALQAARAVARETSISKNMRAWAQAHARDNRAPVYMAFFSRHHPYAPGWTADDIAPRTAGAYHTSDVPYWLDTLDAYNLRGKSRNWGVADRKLAEQMSMTIISLARNGKPAIAGIDWPAWSPARENFMVFGDTTRPQAMNAGRMDFAAKLPASRPDMAKMRD